MQSQITRVWIFNGESSHLPNAVFLNLELAEKWIREKAVSGILTAYPLDIALPTCVTTNFNSTFEQTILKTIIST